MEEDRFTRARRAEGTAGEGGWRPGVGLLAVVVVLLLLRGGRKSAGGVCPHCSAALNFPSHMSEFNCPSCGRRVESRG